MWLNTFPYLGVFSGWLASYGLWDGLHLTFGQYTFAGVFDLLHIHTRVAGLYTEQVVINGSQYNIYTAFRGLVQDFTVPGALAFLVLVGFLAELTYKRARSGNLLYARLLAAFYAATLWSFVVDIFIYNTIVLAFVLLIGYLAAAPRLRDGHGRAWREHGHCGRRHCVIRGRAPGVAHVDAKVNGPIRGAGAVPPKRRARRVSLYQLPCARAGRPEPELVHGIGTARGAPGHSDSRAGRDRRSGRRVYSGRPARRVHRRRAG